MNLRKISLKYMGWCPGVKSAARFIPDRNIPPTRVVLAVVIVLLTSGSSYFTMQRALANIGFPKSPVADVRNTDPILAVSDGQLYITMNVKTNIRNPAQSPTFSENSIYTARLSLNGTLEDEVNILDLGKTTMRSKDLIVTEDGRWFMVYSIENKRTHVIHSEDGKNWSNPETIAVGKGLVWSSYPKLTETAMGELFLLFSNSRASANLESGQDAPYFWNYMIYNSEAGWGPIEEAPMMVVESQWPFLTEDGRIAIVGVDWDHHSRKAIGVEGLFLTVMGEDGDWTEPRYLTHLGVPLRGENPKMYYCNIREGYFLLMKDPDHAPIISAHWLFFTPDLEHWGRPVSFFGSMEPGEVVMEFWGGSLIELQDGLLVLVFDGFTYENSYVELEYYRRISRSLYVSTSGDGDNWTTPISIEKIRDEEALEAAARVHASMLRFLPSVLTSLAVTAFTLIIMSKIPGACMSTLY